MRIATLFFPLGLLACAPRAAHVDVAAAGAAADPALLVLPRTCTRQSWVDDRHVPPGKDRLRNDVRDTVRRIFPLAAAPEPPSVEACRTPPEISPALLGELRASRPTLERMSRDGARSAVVLELQVDMVCAITTGSALAAHYGGWSVATARTLAGRDRCVDDDIALAGYVFDDEGRAVWAGRTRIDDGRPLAPQALAFLARVPVRLAGVSCRADGDIADCR